MLLISRKFAPCRAQGAFEYQDMRYCDDARNLMAANATLPLQLATWLLSLQLTEECSCNCEDGQPHCFLLCRMRLDSTALHVTVYSLITTLPYMSKPEE